MFQHFRQTCATNVGNVEYLRRQYIVGQPAYKPLTDKSNANSQDTYPTRISGAVGQLNKEIDQLHREIGSEKRGGGGNAQHHRQYSGSGQDSLGRHQRVGWWHEAAFRRKSTWTCLIFGTSGGRLPRRQTRPILMRLLSLCRVAVDADVTDWAEARIP